MSDIGEDVFPSDQSTATPAVVSPVSNKDSSVRPHGEKLKMMNPTPNGYSSVPNHKSKSDGQDTPKKHHDSSKSHGEKHHKHSDSSKHHSDHVKKKEGDSTKHKHSSSSSHSKHKDGSNSKSDTVKNDHSKSKEHHNKEKKHHSSPSKDSSKTKESSHKHTSEHSKHSGKKEDKPKSEDKPVKKEHQSSSEKPKLDNFKENEKIKNSSAESKSKDSKEKHREKHHSESKDSKSSNVSRDKDSEKQKIKTGEKPKEKMKEKSLDKPKHGDKSKDRSNEKGKDQSHDSEHRKSSSLQKEKESSPMKGKGVKDEPLSDDEIPLSSRKPSKPVKRKTDDDDEPLSSRIEKVKKIKSEKPLKKRKVESDEDDDDDYKKPVKKVKKPPQKVKQEEVGSPKKRGAKKEDEQEVWKWWEEEKRDDGTKWRTLDHCGPVFAPPYERVPKNVKFYYDGKHMELSDITEEVAGFYGRMLDHEYTTKDVFNTNFFKDWRKVMTPKEKEKIADLKKCNFKDFDVYYKQKSEERKNMTKDEKLVIKKQNEEMTAKYGFCIIDGHKQKIGNFKIEPPGLFRGRGEHPKMGMLKRRVESEDILINIGRESKAPPPPDGHKWKEVRHDNTVSWLASWSENILGSTKYIMLNPSSKLKGEKDWQKYETARKLKKHASRIQEEYTRDFKSKEMRIRQRAVALYFIDKLALRAGNEKEEDTADTVGCCSLRVEHITLDEERDGQEFVVSFDFLGKDSIRYENSVPIEKRAFKNVKLFMENKQPGDDLFDRLNTAVLNKYLNELMEGLTAKVFRTYNASKTLQEQLDNLTKEDMSIPEKVLAYNRANRAVAILCNHQRAVPKGFSKSMDNLKMKMDEKIKLIKDCRKDVKNAKQAAKGSAKEKMIYDKKKKRLQQLEEQLSKLELQATDREENKQIALGTSKLNYLDPRISVAWCKKWSVPIEKVYNKTQRDKFRWAIEMAGPDYKF